MTTATHAPVATLYVHTMPSPLGAIDIAVDDAGRLMSLDFATRADRAERRARGVASVPRTKHVVDQLVGYFEGTRTEFELSLAPHGTTFQKAVWEILRTIPFGSTTSYGELARLLGRPTAARAVGRANALNPIAIVVPCHRVIGANGALTGYAGGLDIKQRLLDHERPATLTVRGAE